jgi:hypothetical protein
LRDGNVAARQNGKPPNGVSAGAPFEVMATRLGAVAAGTHIAPTSRGIPAAIEKQPSTGIVGALPDPVVAPGNDEVCRRPYHRG